MAAATMMAHPGRHALHAYPQSLPYAVYEPRIHQPQVGIAQHTNTIPYINYRSQQSYQTSPRSSHSPSSPASADNLKPSLPSISNLLGIADRPTNDNRGAHRPHRRTPSHPLREPPQPTRPLSPPVQATVVEPRPWHRPHSANAIRADDHQTVPPPPLLRNDSVLEVLQSPSAVSTTSSRSGPPYYTGSSTISIERVDRRTSRVQAVKRRSTSSQPSTSPYSDARYQTSPYATSPSAASATSYYSPTGPTYPVAPTHYQQRPLPTNFPPQLTAAIPMQPAMVPTSNPWEHHHYISSSSQATYPQSQDRYICPTCNKAFSRPSSLKIHSHSHTGEKPFRCSHLGCAKAFSVRSNMKRHERGCHAGSGGHMAPHHVQPQAPSLPQLL